MSYRRTHDVKGFSPLDRIDRSNVDELEMVWSFSMRDDNRDTRPAEALNSPSRPKSSSGPPIPRTTCRPGSCS